MAGAMRIGDRITIRISDVAFGGDGVGRTGERVVFVPFTVDGDVAEVEITDLKRRYARGRPVGIVAPSPHRTEPACPYYARCGGCRMQHILYGHQLEIKERQVAETLRRIVKRPLPPVAPVIPSPRPYGWRIKAEFHLSGGRGASRRVGWMALASHEIVEVERCAILEESLNEQYRRSREALRSGAIRAPGDEWVAWAGGPGEKEAGAADPSGRPADITRIVAGKAFTVSYRGFFQANGFLVDELVGQVVAMSALTGSETVVDAYGGAGLFSLFLGPRAGRLVGIEGDREAVRCARINLDRAGLRGAEFIHGDVADVLERTFVRLSGRADVVILDPPRDGCGEAVIEKVAALRPRRIVYVSCNPATLARDIGRLAKGGYLPSRLQPLDMFPQTAHVEVVALLTPADGDGEDPEG